MYVYIYIYIHTPVTPLTGIETNRITVYCFLVYFLWLFRLRLAGWVVGLVGWLIGCLAGELGLAGR